MEPSEWTGGRRILAPRAMPRRLVFDHVPIYNRAIGPHDGGPNVGIAIGATPNVLPYFSSARRPIGEGDENSAGREAGYPGPTRPRTSTTSSALRGFHRARSRFGIPAIRTTTANSSHQFAQPHDPELARMMRAPFLHPAMKRPNPSRCLKPRMPPISCSRVICAFVCGYLKG